MLHPLSCAGSGAAVHARGHAGARSRDADALGATWHTGSAGTGSEPVPRRPAGGIFTAGPCREVQCPPRAPQLLRSPAFGPRSGGDSAAAASAVSWLLSWLFLVGRRSLVPSQPLQLLETHTGDASHFPCSHACLPPRPWLAVLSRPENEPKGA